MVRFVLIILLSSSITLTFDCKSQIDTTSMFSEIQGLKNDSLINSYWEKIYESDQDIGTFGSTTVQIENWLKCVAFFKEFGFTHYQYQDTSDKTLNNFCMYAKIIWMHSPSIDLNIQSYPLINKFMEYDLNFEWRYLNQKIFFLADTIPNDFVSPQYINNNDDINEIYINNLVRLGNEYIAFRNSKNQVLGKWKVGKFCLELTKTEDEKYFLEYLGSLKRVYPLGSKKYAFDLYNQETQISIIPNKNLLLKSEMNKVLNSTYKCIHK